MNQPSWADAPCIYVVAPACPACGSLDYQKIRTEANGDGSATKKVICRACSERFKIVVELPESGNDELDAA